MASRQFKKFFPASAALIAIAAFLWGLDGVLFRPSLHDLKAILVVFVEHLLAVIILIIIIIIAMLFSRKTPDWLAQDLRSIRYLRSKDWFAIGWTAFFGGLIGTLAITQALFYVGFVPLSIPILIQKTQPLIVALFAWLVLREKLTRHYYWWLGLALLGSYLVTFGLQIPEISLSNKQLLAGLLGLVAAFAWGTSTVFSRKIMTTQLTFRAAVFLRFSLTAVIAIIAMWLFFPRTSFAAMNAKHWQLLIIVALSTGLTASILYYYGLRKTPARISGLCELAFPLTVVVGDYLINQVVMTVPQFIGAAILLFVILKNRDFSHSRSV
ncbi:MAG: EamA family transporter [Candidatus Moranbacteria bacterium]|nr:EamA family transporter [Candidatus Moranbacteria bacterium]